VALIFLIVINSVMC